MNWSMFAAFLLAVTLGAMVPGPTTALIVRRSALYGVRAAVPLVVGIEIGLYGWVMASALGLAAVLAASETAYTVLRLVGAGVLIGLGVQAWLAARRTAEAASPADGTPADPESQVWWRAGVTGAVTHLSNPKVAVFMVAFFPQFVPPGADVLATTLLLGLVQVLIDGAWFLVVAALAGRAGAALVRPRFRRVLERVTGTVLIGLGLRMAVSKL